MRVRVARIGGVPIALGVAIALSGCELGIYGYQKAGADACAASPASCPLVVDAAGDGPVQAHRSDADRAAIVDAAAAAPVRQCTLVPLLCQGSTIGDVIVDQYVTLF
ncbi:MAG: hypothetical protein WAS73_18385 [Defluviicoccus sp.]